MSQRGSVGIYLLFSIAVAVAVGFGTYRFMRDHKSAEPEVQATPKTVEAAKAQPVVHPAEPDPIAVAVPAVEPPPPPVALPKDVADDLAVDPAINDDYETPSPAMGVAGINGGIERTSVDRRFRARASALQHCFENSAAEAGVVRVTMLVEPTGKISSVKLSPGWDDRFATCMNTLVSEMSFSRTHDGKGAVVVQPIRFH